MLKFTEREGRPSLLEAFLICAFVPTLLATVASLDRESTMTGFWIFMVFYVPFMLWAAWRAHVMLKGVRR